MPAKSMPKPTTALTPSFLTALPGLQRAEGAAGGGGKAPEDARVRKVDDAHVPLRDDEDDPRGGEAEGGELKDRDGLVRRGGDPADHEERARDDHDGRRGRARVPNGEKERELRGEHAEAVDHDVSQKHHVGEELSPFAAFREEGRERKQHARAEDAQRHEVLSRKAAVRHHDLGGHAHGAPAEAGGDGKKKTGEHAADGGHGCVRVLYCS